MLVFGAAIGGALGYLLVSNGGRTWLGRLDGWLDASVEQMQAIQRTTKKGRRALEEVQQTLYDLERALEALAQPTSESRREDGAPRAGIGEASRR
jgi:hypothetical protein